MKISLLVFLSGEISEKMYFFGIKNLVVSMQINICLTYNMKTTGTRVKTKTQNYSSMYVK